MSFLKGLFASIGNSPTSMTEYSNKDWGFQLAYPSTWKVFDGNRQADGWNVVLVVGDASGKNGTVGMLVNARDGAVLANIGGPGQLRMSVVSIGAEGQTRTLAQSPAEFLRRIQDDDAAAFPGYRTVASGELTIGKSQAVRRIYSYDGQRSRRQEMSIIIFCAMSTYDLLFEAPAIDWTRHEPTFQRIVDSFHWLHA
jgi:hypothetical protein